MTPTLYRFGGGAIPASPGILEIKQWYSDGAKACVHFLGSSTKSGINLSRPKTKASCEALSYADLRDWHQAGVVDREPWERPT